MKVLVDLKHVESGKNDTLVIEMRNCEPDMAYREILRWMYGNEPGKQVTVTARGK